MNSLWPLRLVMCASGVAAAFAEPAKTPLIPLEDFAHSLQATHATISPDGKVVAYVDEDEKEASLRFLNLASQHIYSIHIPHAMFSPLEFGISSYYTWVGPDRVVYSPYHTGLAAINYDGSKHMGLSGEARRPVTQTTDRDTFVATEVLHAFTGPKAEDALLLEFDMPTGLYDGQFWHFIFPNVYRINTYSGLYSRALDNLGNVLGWLTDAAGVVRIGEQTERGLSRTIYRESEKAGWRPLEGLDYNGRRNHVLGLAGDGKTLYLSRITPAGKWGVYAYDIPTEKLGEIILAHDRYDIVPESILVGHDGFSMQSLIFSRIGHELMGIRYVTEIPRTFWLDPTLGVTQAAIDQALPKRINTITSFSDDKGKVVVLSWTGRDPGTYYLFDQDKKSLTPILARMPWIKPEQMAEVYPISYKARDGLLIGGYLTVPAGREAKHLPLVVYPHGGPWARDSLEFDELAQFLASRGYAVLQMNYRGSTGYGDDFLKKGHREIGHKLQDDIADGTRWAVDHGIADSSRIAIMGASYGGYSTLMGLIQTPELYRCGIEIAGVTDWRALLSYVRSDSPLGYSFVRSEIGDPEKDVAALKTISPVALVDKIRVPLLIVHGKDDPTVPYAQATALMTAMDQAHLPYELMAKQNELHGFRGHDDIVAEFTRIEQFLAKNMQPAAGSGSKQ